jgi:hypothetical protein
VAPLITVWKIVPTNGDCLFAPILCRVSEGSANAKETKILLSELGSIIFSDAAISMEAGLFETL